MRVTHALLLPALGLKSAPAIATRVMRTAIMRSPQEQLAPSALPGALDFDDVATIPRPGSQGLSMVSFSPDDRYVTYLGSVDSTSLTRQLFAFDRETGETSQVITPNEAEVTYSKEEQLMRERARIMSTGITHYQWAAAANRLLVPIDGALHVLDGVLASPRRLFDPSDERWAAVGSGPLLDPKLSSDGTRVFFVWDGEVCSCNVPDDGADAAEPARRTFGARGEGKSNGLADYCAQEEMDRYTGYWPSPDGRLIAYEEVDERHIPEYQIPRHADDPSESDAFRYPFAGAANPKVRLGVSAGEGGDDVVWFDLTAAHGDDFYLARVDWAADGKTLLAQVCGKPPL